MKGCLTLIVGILGFLSALTGVILAGPALLEMVGIQDSPLDGIRDLLVSVVRLLGSIATSLDDIAEAIREWQG